MNRIVLRWLSAFLVLFACTAAVARKDEIIDGSLAAQTLLRDVGGLKKLEPCSVDDTWNDYAALKRFIRQFLKGDGRAYDLRSSRVSAMADPRQIRAHAFCDASHRQQLWAAHRDEVERGAGETLDVDVSTLSRPIFSRSYRAAILVLEQDHETFQRRGAKLAHANYFKAVDALAFRWRHGRWIGVGREAVARAE